MMKSKRKIPKSPGPRSPKLAALETEIMEQHIQGKKIAAIQKWLKTEKKITIAYSNLYNFVTELFMHRVRNCTVRMV